MRTTVTFVQVTSVETNTLMFAEVIYDNDQLKNQKFVVELTVEGANPLTETQEFDLNPRQTGAFGFAFNVVNAGQDTITIKTLDNLTDRNEILPQIQFNLTVTSSDVETLESLVAQLQNDLEIVNQKLVELENRIIELESQP